MAKKTKDKTDQQKDEQNSKKLDVKRLLEKSEEKRRIADKTIRTKFGEKGEKSTYGSNKGEH